MRSVSSLIVATMLSMAGYGGAITVGNTAAQTLKQLFGEVNDALVYANKPTGYRRY